MAAILPITIEVGRRLGAIRDIAQRLGDGIRLHCYASR
jgi:hypothetical protein